MLFVAGVLVFVDVSGHVGGVDGVLVFLLFIFFGCFRVCVVVVVSEDAFGRHLCGCPWGHMCMGCCVRWGRVGVWAD